MRATTRDRLCRSSQSFSAVQILGIAAAVLLLLSAPPARADDTWSLTTTGDWSNAGYWSGGLPTLSTNADINNGGTATISTTGDACSNLYLGNGTGNSGTVNMTGGSLAVAALGSEYVGYSGTGPLPNPAARTMSPALFSTSATTPAASEPTT